MEEIKSLERGHAIVLEYAEILSTKLGKVARDQIKKKHGISTATLYRWMRVFGGIEPWEKTYKGIVSRCKNHPLYRAQGIRCRITVAELKELWIRDKADDMDRPSIDRVDPDGDYVFHNCRYLELRQNCARARYSSGFKIPTPFAESEFSAKCREFSAFIGIRKDAAKKLKVSEAAFGRWCRGLCGPAMPERAVGYSERMDAIMRTNENK